MTTNDFLQIGLFLVVLLLLVKPVGSYMALVFADTPNGITRFGGRVERGIYRLCGISSIEEMSWKRYALAMLLFNVLGLLVLYLLQRTQQWLPLNPQHFAAVAPDSAINTAISFASNTNWQGYAGESTMSYLTQMLALTVQNFVSAATGIAVLFALIRGLSRHCSATVGNFWADMVRSTLYVLLPLSLALALALVSQGVIQNVSPYLEAQTIEPVHYSQPRLDAQGQPVLVQDVATVVEAPRQDQSQVFRYTEQKNGQWSQAPAVSLAVAKRQGANAVVLTRAILARVAALKGPLIPAGVDVAVTRDYGESANEKANELLFHLGLATVSIVVLIGFAIGWREAGVTAVVIPTTILLTLFASNLMGYTINRVSLFALIFSIGILVDDAIVMIENISRHWGMNDGRPRAQAVVDAVAEVGNPTVIATLTVVAALLPMLFVSGLMGPYMAPIPVNASAAMVFSFFVAVILAPWLMIRFARKALPGEATVSHHDHEGFIGRIYRRVAAKVIADKKTAWRFLIGVGAATLLACAMFATKTVTVKLLPFDNKSELQVIADLPEGTTLETTQRVLAQAARIASRLKEVEAVDSYAGTAAPFNFNGLVRHYYFRQYPEQGDLNVQLLPKGKRSRASHAIAIDLRNRLRAIALPQGGVLKVVEAGS